jgi:hypothetical protein
MTLKRHTLDNLEEELKRPISKSSHRTIPAAPTLDPCSITPLMSPAVRWLKELRYLSETAALLDCFRHWGFTVYRTGYGPSSDQQWEKLFQKIQTQAYEKILRVTGATESDPSFQQIWSLFCLDASSDPALGVLDMDQLRLLYRNGDGGAPINADLRSHRVFLVADDEILSDTDAFTVKCREPHW